MNFNEYIFPLYCLELRVASLKFQNYPFDPHTVLSFETPALHQRFSSCSVCVCVCVWEGGGGLDIKETCCVCYIFGSALLFQVSLANGIIRDDDDDETLKALNIMTMLLEKSTQT